MKKQVFLACLYSFLIMIAGTSFLFSPKPVSKTDYLGKYIHINSYMGFTVNGDAHSFCMLAEHPSYLFREKEQRGNRPLYSLFGTAFYYPVNACLKLTGFKGPASHTDVNNINEQHAVKEGGIQMLPSYIGFIIINFIFMLVTLLLFDYLLKNAGVSQLIILLLSFILLFNPIVKAFFWTAHLQMLNLLAPVYFIHQFMMIANQQKPLSSRQLGWMSFGNGLLLLLYGNFVLLLPVMLFGLVLNARFNKEKLRVWRLALVFIGIALPTLLWMLILEIFAFGYYNLEIDIHRQFVWVLDYLKQGLVPFLNQWIYFTGEFFKTLMPVLVFLVIAITLNIRKKIILPKGYLNIKAASVIVFILIFVFIWFLGMYLERLSYSMIPLLLFIIGVSLEELKKPRIVIPVSILFVAIWVIYQVTSYGPFT